MKLLSILRIGLIFAATSSFAENFEGCSKDEVRIISDAMRNAKELTLKAATTVADTPEYERWFGAYTQGNAETVRANLKAIVFAIRSGGVTTQCDGVGIDGCEGSTYAWVYAGEPFRMYLCPSFFNLPPLVALQPGSRSSNNGTREGTLVHELSHFMRVAGTEDHCYSRTDCTQLADRNPRLAVENADSYQYFTEDVTYYARRPVTGKPPPAANRGN